MSDLLYSEVEEQLRASVRALLAAHAPWTAVLARTESDEPYDPALWTALAADLGAAGLAVPAAAGGQGASWREMAVVAEELGRSLAATPFLGSAVIATALVARVGANDLLRALATGQQSAAVAVPLSLGPGARFPADVQSADGLLDGAVRGVADAATADHLLVAATGPDGPGIYLLAGAAAQRATVVSLDLTRPLSDLTFHAAPARQLLGGDAARQALDAALVTGAALLASEQVGLAERCLEMTVEYLKVRYQFGRPIGSYQALKHRAADVWAGITQARAVARYAAECLATGDPDTAVAASLAQAYTSAVAVKAAEECVQLHGGIGFTWEHPAHLYLKRAKADAIALGTAGAHRDRLAQLVGLPASAVSDAGCA